MLRHRRPRQIPTYQIPKLLSKLLRRPKMLTFSNVLPLAAVGDFGALHCQPSTNVDRITAIDLTTSAPIAANGCVCPAYAGHTPKAFQIVQKYKFSFMNQVFGVLFFQRVQVPYERIENPNR